MLALVFWERFRRQCFYFQKDLELLQDVEQEDDFEEYEIQGNDFDSEPISKLDVGIGT